MANQWTVRPMESAVEGERAGWHHYTESGLDNVWLDGGVQRHETAYGPGISIKDVDGLNAVIADWLVSRKSYWSGREVRFLRKRMGLSQKGLADLLGYSDQQVRRWESDKAEIPAPASRLIRLLVREWDAKADEPAPVFIQELLEHAVEADGIRVAA